MRELAFLNKGVNLVVLDKTLKKEKKIEFKYDGGIIEFVNYLNEKKEKLKNKNVPMGGVTSSWKCTNEGFSPNLRWEMYQYIKMGGCT